MSVVLSQPIVDLGDDGRPSWLSQEAEIPRTQHTFGNRIGLAGSMTLWPVHLDRVLGDLGISEVLVWQAIVASTVARRDLSRAWTGDKDCDEAGCDEPLETKHRKIFVRDVAVIAREVDVIERPVRQSHVDRCDVADEGAPVGRACIILVDIIDSLYDKLGDLSVPR